MKKEQGAITTESGEAFYHETYGDKPTVQFNIDTILGRIKRMLGIEKQGIDIEEIGAALDTYIDALEGAWKAVRGYRAYESTMERQGYIEELDLDPGLWNELKTVFDRISRELRELRNDLPELTRYIYEELVWKQVEDAYKTFSGMGDMLVVIRNRLEDARNALATININVPSEYRGEIQSRLDKIAGIITEVEEAIDIYNRMSYDIKAKALKKQDVTPADIEEIIELLEDTRDYLAVIIEELNEDISILTQLGGVAAPLSVAGIDKEADTQLRIVAERIQNGVSHHVEALRRTVEWAQATMTDIEKAIAILEKKLGEI